MTTGDTPSHASFDGFEGFAGVDVEAVCRAALDVLDAHVPMVEAALSATERLIRGIEDGAEPDDLDDARERVSGLVTAARGLAGRIGRGADLALHLLSERPEEVEQQRAAMWRREIRDRIGDLGGLSARLRMSERQLAALGSERLRRSPGLSRKRLDHRGFRRLTRARRRRIA